MSASEYYDTTLESVLAYMDYRNGEELKVLVFRDVTGKQMTVTITNDGAAELLAAMKAGPIPYDAEKSGIVQ